MDSLTQLTLGAAVGEMVAGKKAGNKAILWGAIAGTIPDLDIIAGYFMNTVNSMAFHRTVTHSITFAILLSPILGFGLKKLYKNLDITWKHWTLLFILGFITHALLDCFTTWGTQLFWPFYDIRIAFKSIFVIDPLYTLPLLACLVWLMFLPKDSLKRRRLNTVGLSISTAYLALTLIVKYQANKVFESSFEQNNMAIERYSTRPSPLNIILWTVNAETENGYYIGYYSFLDNDKSINYSWYPKDHGLLTRNLSLTEDLKQLINLSNGWYTINTDDNGLIYNDLRFGQLSGWKNEKGDFVFSYKIVEQDGIVNVYEIEREVEEGIELLKDLWRRILGKKENYQVNIHF